MNLKTLKGETYKNRLLIDHLRSLTGIRAECNKLLLLATQQQLLHFTYHPENMRSVVDFVLQTMRNNYPTLDIPYHSRWRHFEAGGIDRIKILNNTCTGLEQAMRNVELVIISVLLDAGAGVAWRYMDHLSNTTLSKSEGLAVASFNLFMQDFFADASSLQNMTAQDLADGLQVSDKNPLVGLNGRVAVLQALGTAIENKTEYFADKTGPMRLGNIVKYWLRHAVNSNLSMSIIFTSLLESLSQVLIGKFFIDAVSLGDVWPHSLCVSEFNPQGLVPLHKLTQWLCYSLIEPLQNIGLTITDIDLLTGLPEYRNGGLFVDFKVLTPKDANMINIQHSLGSEFVLEWRAMTVALLDVLAENIRAKLDVTAEQLPLSKILQGGTWAAGRAIAAQLRVDAGPPFKLDSDGTLF